MDSMIIGGCCGSSVSPIFNRDSRLTTSFGIVRGSLGIVIDHGYGVHNVAEHLLEAGVVEVIYLQTHYHLDHLAALPLNRLLFEGGIKQIGFFGPYIGNGPVGAWNTMFSADHWTVKPRDFGIEVPVKNLTEHASPLLLERGISYTWLNHPGHCLAYRIATSRGDIVVATDHEPGNPQADARYANFVNGAKVLIADVQYRQSEYDGEVGIGGRRAMKRQGWGHATPESLLRVLKNCGQMPESILITHHDPRRPQEDLDIFCREARAILSPNGSGGPKVNLAFDEMTFGLER